MVPVIKARILIVEDEAPLARAVSTYLEKVGHDVEVAGSVEHALQHLDAENPFQFVLLDLNLPGAHGSVLLREVRRRFPATAVIVTSGTRLIEDAIQAFRAGAVDFLRKPFTPDAVSATVDRLMESESLRQDATGAALPSTALLPLSRREIEIANAVVDVGATPKIARSLHISPHTVRNHLKSIYDKLGVHSRAELVKLVIAARDRS